MRVAVLLVLVCGCSSALPPLPADRALCYAVADRRAQARVDAECGGGVSFAECPAHDDIMAELQRSQEACPQ